MRKIIFTIFALSASSLSIANTPKIEETEPISKTEFVVMQQKLFSKADTDFNGLISFQELNVAEFQRLKQFSGMQFKRLDTNSNNFLSEDEIIADHFNDQANFADNMQGSKASLLKTYDLDRNGSITTDEIDIALERREVKLKRDAKKEGRKTFKKIDKDGNGFISKDEHEHNSTFFLEALMGNSPAGKYLTRDTNGDRVIHRDEHKEFVEILFQILDKNKNEELSAAEQKTEIYKTFQSFDVAGVFANMEDLMNASKNQTKTP